MGAPRKGNSLMIIAEAAKLPGAVQGVSDTNEVYFDNSDGVDAKVSVPIASIRKRPFIVRAGGQVKGGVTGTPDLTILLDAGSDGTNTNNTTIFTSGVLALDADTTTMTWYIEATLMLGEVNSKLQGRGFGWVNNTVVAAAISTESVEDLIADGVLHFKVAGQMSESDAGHTMRMEFLEVLCDGRPV